MRLFSVINPIMEQVSRTEKPFAVHRKIVALQRKTNKTFELDEIPKEIPVNELEFVVILKASYKKLEAAKQFLKLDEVVDKI